MPAGSAPAGSLSAGSASARPLRALQTAYALNAMGLVPHMVFLVDFIARGRGAGLVAGAHHWVLFGLGAVSGPLLAGRLADRIGFRVALQLTYATQCVTVGLLALPLGEGGVAAGLLALSCLVTGACTPAISALALGRVQELVPGAEARRAAWGTATVAWGVGQAAGAYALSALFSVTGRHAPLFAAGAAALALAFVIGLFGTRRRG